MGRLRSLSSRPLSPQFSLGDGSVLDLGFSPSSSRARYTVPRRVETSYRKPLVSKGLV